MNNAGIFFAKPFTEYTPRTFRALSSTNLDGFIHTTQLAVKQMLSKERRQCGEHHEFYRRSSACSIDRIRPNGRHQHDLAESRDGIRAAGRSPLNVVAPGVINTPLHKNNPKEFLHSRSPLGQISRAKDIAEAVFYLTEASHVAARYCTSTAEAHLGRW